MPAVIKKVLNLLNENGFESYVVGGCVRDILLGKKPNDWDITTQALPEQVKAIFKHTYDTGIKHGTVTVVIDETTVEVTTFRIEDIYVDYRRPTEVFFTNNLIEDLKRRDFTMNSIAFNYNSGFVDPFNGVSDIKKKLIKGVGNPSERFNEDALRMLRALRFSAQLNFDIDNDTFIAIIDNAHLIINISCERIRDELIKILISANPEKINTLKSTGLLNYILSDMNSYIDDTSSQLKAIDADILLRLVVFFQSIDNTKLLCILKNLKFDNFTIKTVTQLHSLQFIELSNDAYFIRKLISNIGIEQFKRLLLIKKGQCCNYNIKHVENIFNVIIANNDCLFIKDLAINGDTLIEIGIKKGKDVGYALNFLLDCVLKDPSVNSRGQLIDLISSIHK